MKRIVEWPAKWGGLCRTTVGTGKYYANVARWPGLVGVMGLAVRCVRIDTTGYVILY